MTSQAEKDDIVKRFPLMCPLWQAQCEDETVQAMYRARKACTRELQVNILVFNKPVDDDTIKGWWRYWRTNCTDSHHALGPVKPAQFPEPFVYPEGYESVLPIFKAYVNQYSSSSAHHLIMEFWFKDGHSLSLVKAGRFDPLWGVLYNNDFVNPAIDAAPPNTIFVSLLCAPSSE